MNRPPPEGWKQINKEEFKALLAVANWKRDGWADAQIYSYVHNGERFAWESDDGETIFVDPKVYRSNEPIVLRCCNRPVMPKWRISPGMEMSPRYVSVCPECKKETPCEVDDAARGLLRYALVNDLLEVDPAIDNVERRESKEEPESIREFRRIMQGETDAARAVRIWFEFRYALKHAPMTGKELNWTDIKALLQAAIKRTRKHITNVETRNNMIGRFVVMIKRCEEFEVNPEADLAQKCEKCQLPKFICPCPKE